MPSSMNHFIVLTCWLIVFVLEANAYSNITNKYMFLDDDHLLKGRFIGHDKPKFLTFQATDDDISVELQLSVPFLTIPVKKTINSATGMMEKFKPANVNLAAVGLAGLMVIFSSYVIPTISKLISFDHVMNGGMFGRADDSEKIWIQDIAIKLEQILDMNGVPPTSCLNRIICSLIKKSTIGTEKIAQNSVEKIIDGLASNEWILEMLKNTIFLEAISDGYNGENCSIKYSKCKIKSNILHGFLKTLSAKIFNR